MIFGLIIIYITIAIISLIIMAENAPIIEDFIILNILRWKEINLFGKIFLIFITFPVIIIEYIIAGIKFIFTWHPEKKN